MPEPLTPADCDLRGMEWMPLYGDRLFASNTWLKASPEGKLAALALWWAAWKQKPAASLEDDDTVLAGLAGYGMAPKAWKAIREQALRGWVKCEDGRLYHPVVAELAREAWDRRVKERERKAKWRQGRDESGDGQETGTGRGQDSSEDVAVRVEKEKTGQDRTGQEKNKKEEPPSHPSGVRSPLGTRLAETWQPEDGQYAQSLGLDAASVLRDFRDYWCAKAGKDARKLDWERTWQRWCRQEAKRRPAASSQPSKLGWMLQ